MKKLITTMISVSMLFFIQSPAHAKDNNICIGNNSNESNKEYTGNLDIDELKMIVGDAGIALPNSDEYLYYSVHRGTEISNWGPYKTCAGQGGGEIFNSYNDGVYWVDSGAAVSNINVSVSFSWGVVSVGVSCSAGTVGGVSGSFWATSIINEPVVAQLSRNYQVTCYDIYRYNKYSGIETATFYQRVYNSTPYQKRHRFVKV